MGLDVDMDPKTHQPCEDCGSSDALTIYDDHMFCFSCEKHTWLDTSAEENVVALHLVTHGSFEDLTTRKIPVKICKKFGYSLSKHNGRVVQLAPYRDQQGTLVAQKVRTKDKEFYTTGTFKDVQLFGQHLWKPSKRLVILEGEIDCLSYATATGGTWPCVSVPNGAASAAKSIARNIEFVDAFAEIVLCFDMDKQGQAAAKEVAEIITPGKCAIAELPLKDASEMLMAGRIKDLTTAIFQARVERPDGIVNGKEIWDDVNVTIEQGTKFPWTSWNDILFGLRPREILTFCAGSGVGKSTICAEISYQLAVRQNRKVGYIALEEGISRTGLRMMALSLDKPIHLPNDVSSEEKRKAFDKTLGTGNFYFYDHFGSLDSDNLIRKLSYMVTALGVEFLILDHLSILVSGLEQDAGGHGDERKAIDYTMTQLRSFTERTNVSLILVSHLRRPQGDKGHEGGEKVYLSHLRGSAAIAHLSDGVVSVSRNMSEGDNQLQVHCLKNRYAGITGSMGTLEYNTDTGRLTEFLDEFGDENVEASHS